MKILLIEDEPVISSSIQTYLKLEGWQCDLAPDFNTGYEKMTQAHYDCLLVDITLPGGSGLELIRRMSGDLERTGVIIISAKKSVEDKVKGLELGADDYLTKPFHLPELNARIKSVIRRKRVTKDEAITFREITLFPDRMSLQVNGEKVDLTRSEYRLLEFFLLNQKKVLSKEMIASHLTGDQIDFIVDLDFVYSHVKNLRKKLTEAACTNYIKAVYGMGYKFGDS